MRLPDFLLIGAMKSGTTTLYRDLESHPRIFMPADKEPHALVSDEVFTTAGRARYADLFGPARDDQLAGEASTGYSKLPERPGVVDRARRLLRPDLRVLYIVRDPIARIASHHYHLFGSGRTGPSIEATLESDARLVGYTRYGTQIEPWLEAYGPELVRVIHFESYVSRRADAAAETLEWMGLDPERAEIDESARHNQGEARRVSPALRPILRSRLYQEIGRRKLPIPLKRLAQRTFLRKAPPRPAPPRPETVDRLLDELWPEMEKLAELLGLETPMWDREALRATHHARYAKAAQGGETEARTAG